MRYRLHDKKLPGKPDLVFPSAKVVVFVHGCYWHRHSCKYGSVMPQTNAKIWVEKLEGNVKRDARSQLSLKSLGWQVLVIWECETRSAEKLSSLSEAIRQSK